MRYAHLIDLAAGGRIEHKGGAMLKRNLKPERAPPQPQRRTARVLRRSGVVAFLIALLISGMSASASALGRDDSCPPVPDGMNLIVSNEPIIYGTAAGDQICGGPGPNVIIGGLLDDDIYGGGGDDILIGGHGTDTLDGGSGNDWLRGGTNADTYVGGANGTGSDTASFADLTPTNGVSGVVVDLGAGTANAGGVVDSLSQIDMVYGSAFDDTITGALAAATPMFGGYGDDVLNGRGGNDGMIGEAGSDTCTSNGTPATCSDGQGTHRPSTAVAFIENRPKDPGLVVLGAEGAVNDVLTVTRPTESPSQLRVAGGARLTPGTSCSGETTINCTLATARYIVVSGDQGNDRLTMGNGLLNGPGSIDVNGGVGDDTLVGGTGDEVLFTGEGGVDTLTGNAGSDALISEGDVGASGGDNLNAGPGNDQIVTDNACPSHTLAGGADNDVIGFARQDNVNGSPAGVYASFAEGRATAIWPAGEYRWECIYTPTTISGGETLEGTNYGDILYGDEAANTIWGRAGNDVLYGNAGDDVIKGQDGEDSIWGYNGADSLYGGNGWDDLHAQDGAADRVIECGADPDPGAERDGVDPVGIGCNDRVPTEAFLTLDRIRNGTPGSVSLHGRVLVTNGSPARGTVNVNYQKLVEGRWETVNTVQRTLDANGYYEVLDQGVGIGEWRVRVVFPEQWHYAQAESEYHEFTIQLIPTETFITLDGTQNGTPGTASVHGHVLRNGNPTVSGTVNVNFQRYVGSTGRWETIRTAVRTLDANGYYEVVNQDVGVGDWRVRAVFPQQGEYEQSESEYKTFTIQPVPTQTFLTLDGFQNGAPGTASVHGHVLRTNGAAASGTVNVNFQRYVGSTGRWETIRTAVRTLDANGYYEVVNQDLGVGDWRVRAVFPEQGDYGQSESEYRTFSIQPVPTNAYVTLDGTLNGQPGYVSVHGSVQRTNGSPASGTVNVNFEKWNGNSWQWQNSATPTLVNGAYDINFRQAGVGQWRVRAVFPAQGDYAQSESEYHSFEIKSGYRLISRHSGKCLSLSANNAANGTPIIQWDCSGSPNPGDGQVFTRVPMEEAGLYYNIKINSTGKCVDVAGANTADGAYLLEWDCLGGGQTNQHWQIIPIEQQWPYIALMARHSGKCMDLLGLATGNGARIGQWGCWWGGNQQWNWQAVD
jgi:Ca2+-binding RTX toxin-like protein